MQTHDADFDELLQAVEARGLKKVLHVSPAGEPPPAERVIEHPQRRLLLGVSGCHQLELCSGEDCALRPGTAVIFDPGTWHIIRSRHARSYVSALCAHDELRFFRRHHNGRDEPGDLRSWARAADPQILQLLDMLRAARAADRSLLAMAAVRLLRRALETAPQGSGAEATWRSLLAFCEEEWQHDLSRDAAAFACGIDPGYVTALFHRFADCSFQDWLTSRRLEEARRLLLAHPELSIKGIAERCGYSDARYFRRMFKRRFGVTPISIRSQG